MQSILINSIQNHSDPIEYFCGTDPDGDDKLTNAEALLADYCPIYQSRLFCTRWNGLTNASGLQDAFDDAEYVTFFFFVDALLIVLYRVLLNLPMVIFIFKSPQWKAA